jgi:hypothetical protein
MKLIISESEKNRILGMHNKVRNLLSEGDKENRVKSALSIIMDGAVGLGTDPSYIIDGLKKLQDKEEFERLNSLIAQRTYSNEYSSFDDLIRKEFESGSDNFGFGGLIGYVMGDNEEDFNEVKRQLDRLNVNHSGGIDDFQIYNVKSISNELQDNPPPPPQPKIDPQPQPKIDPQPVKKPRIRE